MKNATQNLENDHVCIIKLIDVMNVMAKLPFANVSHLEEVVELIRKFADGLHHAKKFVADFYIFVNNQTTLHYSQVMKTKKFRLYFTLLLAFTTFSLQAQEPGFTGEWKLNKGKTVLQGSQIFLSKLTILVKGDSLLTNRTYENADGQEYPFVENLSLDGKESKIVIYDMPRTTKATRSASDGNLILDSTTTFNRDGQETVMNSKETWKVDPGSILLTISVITKMADREFPGTLYLDRVK